VQLLVYVVFLVQVLSTVFYCNLSMNDINRRSTFYKKSAIVSW